MPQPPYTKPIGLPFVELQSVDSTNNYARKQIHAGLAQHGMTIFAHEQLTGKGQRGKSWSSEKGVNIIMSIVIKPQPLLLTQQFMLNACVAVAVYEDSRVVPLMGSNTIQGPKTERRRRSAGTNSGHQFIRMIPVDL